jgi:hypothetical protein
MWLILVLDNHHSKQRLMSNAGGKQAKVDSEARAARAGEHLTGQRDQQISMLVKKLAHVQQV